MQSNQEVLILDDHSMIRKGIRLTIETTFGIKSIHEVSSCAALLSFLRTNNKVTHLLLDLLVSDGNTLEIIPVIKSLYPNIRILVFTMQPPEVYAVALKQYRIYEYLHKEASEEVTISTLRKFLTEAYKADEAPANVFAGESTNPFSKLTPRELEVLHYMLKGVGTKMIADTLNLQMSTISTLKSRIFDKTGAQNIKEIIDLALLYNISS
jgi:two-component system, NarL family, invasion response regulator UvrY